VTEGMFRKFGIRSRSIPIATGVGRTLQVRVGRADFGCTAETIEAQEGTDDFASADWGPQPLRMLYIVDRQTIYSMATAADTDIYTAEDLKGKKIAWTVGSAFTQKMILGSIGFGGLTVDDVELVEVRSTTQAYRAVIEGHADAAIFASAGSLSYELEATRGIRWLPFPPDNRTGWAAFHKLHPEVNPIPAKAGAGLSEESPIWGVTLPHPHYFAYDHMDENTAYWIVKMMVESYDEYKDISLEMKWYTLEDCVNVLSYVPYHAGAVRYFKERGVWTEIHEQNQRILMDRQERLQTLWESTVAEAAAKKVKAKEFTAFWLEKRAKEFPGFPDLFPYK